MTVHGRAELFELGDPVAARIAAEKMFTFSADS